MRRIAILGAGNGGQAVAADLALAGFDVSLFELPEFDHTFAAVKRRREIVIEGVGRRGTARLTKATTDIGEALEGAEVILVIVPAFGHETMARLSAPHLQDGQVVALLPGSRGTLEWHKVLQEMGVRKEVALCESCTLPYGARLVESGRVMVFIEAKILPTGVLPGRRTKEIIPKLQELYPAVIARSNAIEAALNNPNPIVHPAAVLLSATRIE